MTRQDLIQALRDALPSLDFVCAAWLGGSDASGRADERSDIDLMIVAEDDRVEDVFEAVERILARLSPIDHRYRLPSPTWHGHEQSFYALEKAGPYALVDMLVMKKSSNERFLERERHGEPVVLLDRDGIVVPPPLDRDELDDRIARKLAAIRAQFPMFQSFVTKSIERGRATEAMQFYRSMTLIPLVELLRIRHCPDRFDFGLRYLDRDLPADLGRTIDRLSYVADMESLRGHLAEAEALFARYIDT